MYGLIVRLTVHDGERDEMIDVLRESAGNMPGCFCYVVARDSIRHATGHLLRPRRGDSARVERVTQGHALTTTRESSVGCPPNGDRKS